MKKWLKNIQAQYNRYDYMENAQNHIMTKQDLKEYKKKFTEPDFFQNHIISDEMYISIDNRKTNRSLHSLVFGSTAGGKTYRYVEPNILQMNGSMVINDPTGALYEKYSAFLGENGYTVYRFDLKEPKNSCHYNPLMNLYDEDGNIAPVKVDVLVDLYMRNTVVGKETGARDPFWEKGEKLLLTAFIYYVLENDNIPLEDKNFRTIYDKIKAFREGKDAFTEEISKWEKKMEEVGRKVKAPAYFANYLSLSWQSAEACLISVIIDLQFFLNEEIATITSTDRYVIPFGINIDFDELAYTRTCIFTTLPPMGDSTIDGYTMIKDWFFSQLYARLYEIGERIGYGKWYIGHRMSEVFNYRSAYDSFFRPFETEEEAKEFVENVSIEDIKEYGNTHLYCITYKGKVYKYCTSRQYLEKLIRGISDLEIYKKEEYPALPMQVDFYLDEFTGIGDIPNFLTILCTSRKYRISNHVITQSLEQLKYMYPGSEFDILLANTDISVFMGTVINDDLWLTQKMLGKTTIKPLVLDKKNKEAVKYDYETLQTDLVSIDDLRQLNDNDCVVIIRDVPPYIGAKADLKKHPRYAEFESFKSMK